MQVLSLITSGVFVRIRATLFAAEGQRMHSNRKLTSKEQTIKDLITNQKALVSIAFDSMGDYATGFQIDYSHIDDHYLNSMADPTTHRFSRSVDFFGNQWIPKFDILLISLTGNAKLNDQQIQNAQTLNQPILIQQDNNTFSMYNFNYYSDPQWDERPLMNLTDNNVMLLKRFCLDGRIIKKEEGFPDPNNPNTDAQNLFELVSQYHNYLPTVVNKMDMHTREVYLHNPARDRFTINKGKDYEDTSKISMSMPTPDPRYMELFGCDDGIGFLWAMDKCDLKKEKYVFTENAVTDACYWIDLNDGYTFDFETGKLIFKTAEEKIATLNKDLDNGNVPITTIAALRERNQAAVTNKKSLLWNEIVAGAPKRNVEAFFATQDKRSVRLRALRAMLHAKEKLNLPEELPLFIDQPFYAEEENAELGFSKQREAVFRFYSVEEQKEDLASEKLDNEVAKAALAMIRNQNALAALVSDEKDIDKFLESASKVDTSLLPIEPEWMNFSESESPVVGLLWDINSCTLDDDARAMLPELETKNNAAVEQHQVIDRNTLPVTVPHEKINGMFCYYNAYDLDSRLKAIELAEYGKQKLNLPTNIPLFLIAKGKKSGLYSELDQLMDVNSSRWSQALHPQQQPPLTTYEKFVAKRKSALTFFASKPQEEDQDWVKLSKEDGQNSEEKSQHCIVM